MYTVGQMLEGWIYNDQGEEVLVQGTFEFRTNDPEEYIQDIVVRLENGNLQYIDEQLVKPV